MPLPHSPLICMSLCVSLAGATLISLAPSPLSVPTSGTLCCFYPLPHILIRAICQAFANSSGLWEAFLDCHHWYLLPLNSEPCEGENCLERAHPQRNPVPHISSGIVRCLDVSTGGMVLLKHSGATLFLHNALLCPGVGECVERGRSQ